MRFRSAFCLSVAVILFGAVITAQADVPQLINFQGILLDTAGDPVTTPSNVTFAIWNAETDGDSLWSETQLVTPDDEARFNVLLGTVSPVPDSVFEGDAYLSVKVEDDPEMSPRSHLVTVPYSYRVGTIDGATGGTIEGDVNIEGDVYLTGDTILVGDIQIEPTTRYYMIPPAAFTPGVVTDTDVHYSDEPPGITPAMYAPVNLPHGAVITQVTAYFYHIGGGGGSLFSVLLSRLSPVDPPTTDTIAFAMPNPGSDVYDSVMITSIVNPIVDNTSYGYYMKFRANYFTEIYGVRIEYIIESPLP